MSTANYKKLKVFKFGGSSLSTPEKICAVANKISALRREDPSQAIIVVTSAMGKTTDELNGLARRVSAHPNRRELDMLLTTGERISMALMAIALQDRGCPAISFTGSQAGIMTNGSFTNARIQELKPIRVEEALQAGKIVVLAGFQGVDPKTKEITTLGRGGSDTTAVAMAAHFKADSCAFLKDVDGVLNADPRIVPEAKIFSTLPIDVLYEFCFWGAKILNHHSVEMAKQHGVNLEIGRSSDFAIGTTIGLNKTNFKGGEFLGINYHRHARQISIESHTESDGLSQLSAILEQANQPLPHILVQKFHDNRLEILAALHEEDLLDFNSALAASHIIKMDPNELSTISVSKYGEKPIVKIVAKDQLSNSILADFNKYFRQL